MQLTLVHAAVDTLAEVGERRRVCRLSKQLIEICWDLFSLQLRTIDLLVLHNELTECLDAICVEQNEDYLLDINGLQLYLSRADLRSFHTLLCTAVEGLPTQVVRWKEVTVSLSPYDPRLVRRVPLSDCSVGCSN